MKSLLLVTVLAASFSVFADNKEGEAKPFEEMKKMALERTNAGIANLQSSKACIEAAKERADLKKCREELKAKRMEMKNSMMSKRDAFRAMKKKK